MPWLNPIGIPTPDWGGDVGNPIDLSRPTAPAGWTSAPLVEVAGYYYVEPTFEGATDSGRTYGTPAAPRATIPTTPGAGAVIFLHGAYGTALGSFAPSGTNTAPIWLLGFDTETRPIINNGNFSLMAAATHCIIDNVNWFGTAVQVTRAASYICWRSCEIDLNEAESTGMLFYKDGTGWTEQIVIHNCKVTRCGDWQVTVGDPDRQGISFQTYQRDIWVVDCELSYNSGCGVQLVTGTADLFATCPTRIYVGRCTAHHNNQVGIWSKRSVDCVFSQNVCYEMRRDNPASGDGVEQGGLGGQYGHRNFWIIYNKVFNCQAGILIRSDDFSSGETVTDSHIIGNLLYSITNTQPIAKRASSTSLVAGIALAVWGGDTSWIVNNTIDDCDGGIYLRTGSARKVFGNSITNRNPDLRVDHTFTVDAGTNVITATAHGLTTGDLVLLSSTGTLPGGMNASALYIVSVLTVDTLTLGGLDVLDTGTGTHTITGPIGPFDILLDTEVPTNAGNAFDRNAFTDMFLYGDIPTTNDVVPTGDIYVDPTNATLSSRNYAPADGSDLIDVIATPSGVFAEWAAYYDGTTPASEDAEAYISARPSIQYDRTGGTRPWNATTDEAGGNWDIGAYEYGATIPEPVIPPSAPTFSVSRFITPNSP